MGQIMGVPVPLSALLSQQMAEQYCEKKFNLERSVVDIPLVGSFEGVGVERASDGMVMTARNIISKNCMVVNRREVRFKGPNDQRHRTMIYSLFSQKNVDKLMISEALR